MRAEGTEVHQQENGAADLVLVEQPDPDDALVEEALAEIRSIWSQGLLSTVVALGNYLIEKFYGGSVQEARSRRAHKPAALARLLERAEELPVSVHALKQSVRIAVQYRELPAALADQLSKTQHEALLPVTDFQQKLALAREAAARQLSSRQLAEKILTTRKPRRGGRTPAPPVARRVSAVLRALETPGLDDELLPGALLALGPDHKDRMREELRRARELLARLDEALGDEPDSSGAKAETPKPEAGATQMVKEGRAATAPGKRAPGGKTIRKAQPARQAETRRPRSGVDALDEVLATIEKDRPTFARRAPELQRLMMLLWICQARRVPETRPETPELKAKMAKVTRTLADLGRTFSPGTVRALQAATQPGEAFVFHTGHGAVRSWDDAAKLAERTLADQMQKGAAKGLDADGWADGAAAREPAPQDPDAMLEAAIKELRELLGGDEGGKTKGVRAADGERLLKIARQLRWLRGYVRDTPAWGAAIGRLRRSAEALGTGALELREVLEASVAPPMPWAALLAAVEQRPAVDPTSAQAAEMIAAMPGPDQDTDALEAWVLRALDVLSTPELAALLMPQRERVAPLAEMAGRHEDRRTRRRIRELVYKLGAMSAEGGPLLNGRHNQGRSVADPLDL